MPYSPIAPNTDNRRSRKAAIPTVLRNAMLDSAPQAQARRSGYFIVPTPGRTRRATLQDTCRGLFSEPGCRGGRLFAPAGGYFNEVYPGWGFGSVGTITGADDVWIVPFQSDVAGLALGLIYHWDGTTYTQVSDGDAPTYCSTLASVAYRLVASTQTGDGFSWCKAGLFNDWDSSGNAADIYLPDPIVNQFELGFELYSFNSTSIQPWQPTGGSEAEAFATSPGSAVRIGLATRAAIARVGDGAMFLGHDRRIYRMAGGLQPIPNRDLESALAALTQADIDADVRAWSYTHESKTYWGLTAGLERAWVYDLDLGLWHERARYGEDMYDVDFATSAFNGASVVVASSNATYLWSLESSVFTDDGDPIEREMTIHVPLEGDGSIDRIVLDASFGSQPTVGQGSAPILMLSVSTDGGNSWCEERRISLPILGDYDLRVQDFCFGQGSAELGAILKLRITDPIYFAVYGCWINPTLQEVP